MPILDKFPSESVHFQMGPWGHGAMGPQGTWVKFQSGHETTDRRAMPTSSLWLTSMVLFPLHFLQRSLSLMKSPVPPQSSHVDWICCTIPGPMGRWATWIPVPWHFLQRITEPDLPPELHKERLRSFESVFARKSHRNVRILLHMLRLVPRPPPFSFFSLWSV